MTTSHYPEQFPPPPRKRRWPLIVGIAVAAVLLLCTGITVIAAVAGDPDTPTAATEQDTANRAAARQQATTQPATTAPATPAPTTSSPDVAPTTTKPTKTTPPPVLVTDGTYLVGEDIPAGRYKVTERAGDMCYWARKRGTDGDDIVTNHLGGGYPQFTAKRGETVEIMSCPEFELRRK